MYDGEESQGLLLCVKEGIIIPCIVLQYLLHTTNSLIPSINCTSHKVVLMCISDD